MTQRSTFAGKNSSSGRGGSDDESKEEKSKPFAGGKATFLLLWASQLISLLGSEVAHFALRVWTYTETQSVTQFSLITFFTEAPALLLAPFAGVLVDRYPRKACLLLSDSVSALATLFIAYQHHRGNLLPHHIYLSNVVFSWANALQWPAFKATVALLIPPQDLVRYGGLDQAAPALSMLLAPLAAGYIASRYGLRGAFVVEFVTFALASAVTLFATIPSPPPLRKAPPKASKGIKSSSSSSGSGSSSSGLGVYSKILSDLLAEAWEGWVFIARRRGLVGLLLLLACGHLSSGLVRILMMPVLLNLGDGDADASTLGYVLSVSGTGALFGATFLALWGGPKKRKVFAVLTCVFLQGLLLCCCGIVRSAWAMLVTAFLYMSLIPLNRACRSAIWQLKVPSEMQGRVFGIQRAITEGAAPVAALVGGFLADSLFEPWLQEPLHTQGGWALLAARIVGTGKGRGSAAALVVAGLASALAAVWGAWFAPLRRVDIDLPDFSSGPPSSAADAQQGGASAVGDTVGGAAGVGDKHQE